MNKITQTFNGFDFIFSTINPDTGENEKTILYMEGTNHEKLKKLAIKKMAGIGIFVKSEPVKEVRCMSVDTFKYYSKKTYNPDTLII